MSRPRVIKNKGVAIVEGTPASSLVKDVDKFFAVKAPERMAGESVGQPRKIDPRALNIRRPTPKDLDEMNNPPIEESAITRGRRPSSENLSAQEQAQVAAQYEQMMEDKKARNTMSKEGERPLPRRNEAKDKAESRRKRFFQRRRSRKEAERSQTEQEATQGKFITTLGR